MRSVILINRERDLNQVLKRRKTEDFKILYHSLWDPYSKRIINLLDEWAGREGNETIYVVDSWDLPQAFSAFSISSAPSLVHVRSKKVRVDVEYPKVYNYFTAGRPKTA
jgi:hypothetical protein